MPDEFLSKLFSLDGQLALVTGGTGVLGRIVEQRGLSYPRLASQHDGPARPGRGLLDKQVKLPLLRLPIQQHVRTISRRPSRDKRATLRASRKRDAAGMRKLGTSR